MVTRDHEGTLGVKRPLGYYPHPKVAFKVNSSNAPMLFLKDQDNSKRFSATNSKEKLNFHVFSIFTECLVIPEIDRSTSKSRFGENFFAIFYCNLTPYLF